MNGRWIPNAITLARIGTAPLLFWLLLEKRFDQAFYLALIAGISDALDGFLAKRFGWQTALGGVLDPLADKLMLMTAMFGLWLVDRLPGELLALIVCRDLVIMSGALIWWRVNGQFEPAPSLISKINTVLQIILLLAIVLDAAGWLVEPDWLHNGLIVVTAIMTIASGLDYLIRYTTKTLQRMKAQQ